MLNLLHQCFSGRRLLAISLCLSILMITLPAHAVDSYVRRYLATEPISLAQNAQGDIQLYTPDNLSEGKIFFTENCLNCHIGGVTVPNPLVSLSLADLTGATPPRDNIEAIVDFMREPMSYDGEDYDYLCRQISERWLPPGEIENLAAFILRAAQKAPGWATKFY